MNRKKQGLYVFIANIIAFIVAYYVSLLLHEWSHGTVAWLYGLKKTPFDITYGGLGLLHADEHVNYANLLSTGRGITAALIGIAGSSMSLLLALISLLLLNKKSIQQHFVKHTFAYWFLIINMIPLIQYFTISTFSTTGDIGRFTHGLNISAWWIFIPGTIFNIYILKHILSIQIIKMYVCLPIKKLLGQNLLLIFTLFTLFLVIYTHGYNPITDKGTALFGKVLAIFSIILVPVLYIICNPAREWVKRKIANE